MDARMLVYFCALGLHPPGFTLTGLCAKLVQQQRVFHHALSG